MDLYPKQKTLYYTAKIEVDVHDEHNPDQLDFTLYHQLEIENILLDGARINWTRDGEWVKIPWEKGKKSGVLSFEVSGATGIYNPIKNRQMFLSSTFPWYPIAGKWRVAEVTPAKDVIFKNLEPQQDISYDVKVIRKEKYSVIYIRKIMITFKEKQRVSLF